MPAYSISDPAPLSFIVIPVLLLSVLAWGTYAAWRRGGATQETARRATLFAALAGFVWMALSFGAAASGVLRRWDDTPPPFAIFVIAIVMLALLLAYSGLGSRLASHIPLWALVAVQAFRLPLELAMHGMYTRGIMPEQMTYTGLNFDIVTGATAIPVASLIASGWGGHRLAAVWNILGLVLLGNVVTVAILGTPRFRYFGDEQLNTWVTYPPFVWLPAVMVLAALAGHLLIFRALARRQRR